MSLFDNCGIVFIIKWSWFPCIAQSILNVIIIICNSFSQYQKVNHSFLKSKAQRNIFLIDVQVFRG